MTEEQKTIIPATPFPDIGDAPEEESSGAVEPSIEQKFADAQSQIADLLKANAEQQKSFQDWMISNQSRETRTRPAVQDLPIPEYKGPSPVDDPDGYSKSFSQHVAEIIRVNQENAKRHAEATAETGQPGGVTAQDLEALYRESHPSLTKNMDIVRGEATRLVEAYRKEGKDGYAIIAANPRAYIDRVAEGVEKVYRDMGVAIGKEPPADGGQPHKTADTGAADRIEGLSGGSVPANGAQGNPAKSKFADEISNMQLKSGYF